MRKYRFIILLGYYFKIFGEVLIQYLLSRYYFNFFGKVPLPNLAYGTALKSYIGERFLKDNMFFDKKIVLFGTIFQINEKVPL
jgi:hypothetical protein